MGRPAKATHSNSVCHLNVLLAYSDNAVKIINRTANIKERTRVQGPKFTFSSKRKSGKTIHLRAKRSWNVALSFTAIIEAIYS